MEAGANESMIPREHLKVGNTVYATPSWCGEATITKVGSKYTYTTKHNFIIDNKLLMTKYSNTGVSHNEVYTSKDAYMQAVRENNFIQATKSAFRNCNITYQQAQQVNQMIGLGLEPPM